MNDATIRFLQVSLAILVGVVMIGVMRLTSVITVPVGLALFILILAWPLHQALGRRAVPNWLCSVLTFLAILGVFSMIVGILYLCVRNVTMGAPQYGERVAELVEHIKILPDWPDTGEEGVEGPITRFGEKLLNAIYALFTEAYALLGLLTLTATFTILGLLEARAFLDRLAQGKQADLSAKLVEAGREISRAIQRYMLARTLVSGTTGVLVGLYTWMIGLDFPLVWAISSFLLNYVPILGSIIAVIPPTIVGFLQPDLWMGFATLGGLTLIQFSIGYYVDPLLEGRILALSPFVLLFSILFWGWVWGIPGALLGIPLTASIVIVFSKFEPTRWIGEWLQRPNP